MENKSCYPYAFSNPLYMPKHTSEQAINNDSPNPVQLGQEFASHAMEGFRADSLRMIPSSISGALIGIGGLLLLSPSFESGCANTSALANTYAGEALLLLGTVVLAVAMAFHPFRSLGDNPVVPANAKEKQD